MKYQLSTIYMILRKIYMLDQALLLMVVWLQVTTTCDLTLDFKLADIHLAIGAEASLSSYINQPSDGWTLLYSKGATYGNDFKTEAEFN